MGLEVEMVLVPVVRVHYSLKLLSQPPKKYIYTSEKIGYDEVQPRCSEPVIWKK